MDEVQTVPGRFRALKIIVDECRLVDKENSAGQFF